MQLSVVIEKEDKFYVARIPDLGITTQGKSFEEAMKNAKEAAELYLEDPTVKKAILPKQAPKPIFAFIDILTG